MIFLMLLLGIALAGHAKDGDSPLAWSHGILAMIVLDAPNTPIYSWDADTIECPSSSEVSPEFHLKNFGPEAITISCPILQRGDGFTRFTNCPCTSVLAPGQITSCSFTITFAPAQDGIVRDTLRVQTNAWNGFGGFVRFALTGTRTTTPLSPVTILQIEGSDAHLLWSPISESVGGCPLSEVHYLIYFAPLNDGNYSYLTTTTDTSFVHVGITDVADYLFYRVTAHTP